MNLHFIYEWAHGKVKLEVKFNLNVFNANLTLNVSVLSYAVVVLECGYEANL